jgi:hypothetical protein
MAAEQHFAGQASSMSNVGIVITDIERFRFYEIWQDYDKGFRLRENF